MNHTVIILFFIMLTCLMQKREHFKQKRKKIPYAVPELTDDQTADLIGGLQSIGAQACENSKYDYKKNDKNRPKC